MIGRPISGELAPGGYARGTEGSISSRKRHHAAYPSAWDCGYCVVDDGWVKWRRW